MNFGSNFNNRKLFTGEAKSTTHSIDMNRFNERKGARSIDDVRRSRMELRDKINSAKYNSTSIINNSNTNVNNVQPISNTERKFNHIEAMRNIKRGL